MAGVYEGRSSLPIQLVPARAFLDGDEEPFDEDCLVGEGKVTGTERRGGVQTMS